MLGTCFLLLLVVGDAASKSGQVSREEARKLAEEYFEFRIRENPGYAASAGIPKYQDKVEEWNYAAFSRRLESSKELVKKVNSQLNQGFASRTDEVGAKVMKFTLQKYIDGSAFMNYSATLNDDLPSVPAKFALTPLKTMEELRNWYKRVIAYQTVFENQKALLDVGIKTGITQTQIAGNDYVKKYESAIGDDIEDFFAFKPWKYLDVSTSNSTFFDEGRTACEQLRTKIQEFVTKLKTEYVPVCRDMNHTSQSSVPGGDKYYEASLQYYTSDDMTAEKVHKIGLDEVKRITTLMKEIVKAEGSDGTIRDYVNGLYSDSNEFFPTQDALMQGYQDLLKNKVRPMMSKEFYPEPPIAFGFKDDPYGSIGRYSEPKWDKATKNWTSGYFIYDGRKPHEILKITMLPLLTHEGLPGHHYQTAYTLLTDLPDFRKYSAYAHYAQGAFNFPFHGVYLEGWGLYVEYVSEVMGIIKTNKEKLGRLSLESLRASRLVVDTGLHHYNWTFDRAVDYLVENTILSRSTCEGQIRRYIKWPGQSCSYKIGELKIKELRAKAEDKLGDDFDAKEFHKAILELGAVPLEILEEEINHWIDKQEPVPAAAVIISTDWILGVSTLFMMIFKPL